MARTDTAGKKWYGLLAPKTGAPDGASGVSQVRFLNTVNGWAFGPELWATHDGGQTWNQVGTHGLRVTSLETVGSEAFAVFARCTGAGPGFAAGCTKFFLYDSPAGSDSWSPVPGLAGGFRLGAGQASSAAIVLGADRGYFYTPAGTLFSGPVTAGAAWSAVGTAALPCLPGPPGAEGLAAGQLAASAPGDLALACPGSGQPGSSADQQETVYGSTDGGQSWQVSGALTTAGRPRHWPRPQLACSCWAPASASTSRPTAARRGGRRRSGRPGGSATSA